MLVEIFLDERKHEDAWREAKAGGCSDGLWLRLAELREEDHPEDAAPIYLTQAEAAISAVTNGRYEGPVEMLIRAANVMKRLDRTAEFVRRLEGLRFKYRIKRNFIKLLEQNKKSLPGAVR